MISNANRSHCGHFVNVLVVLCLACLTLNHPSLAPRRPLVPSAVVNGSAAAAPASFSTPHPHPLVPPPLPTAAAVNPPAPSSAALAPALPARDTNPWAKTSAGVPTPAMAGKRH